MGSPSAKTTLQWSDAWILLAIIGAATNKRSASLTEIIAHADYINHAIVTRDELELGVEKLIAQGYVLRGKNSFRPSAKAKRLWEQSASREKRVFAALQRVREGIGAPDWEPGPLPTTTSEQYVGKLPYEQAVTEYMARFGNKRKKPSASG